MSYPHPSFLCKPFTGKISLGILLFLGTVGPLPVKSEQNTLAHKTSRLRIIHRKTNLNQSQDRIILKKSFNLNGLSVEQAVSNKEIGVFATVDYALIQNAIQPNLADNDKKLEEEGWLNKILSDNSLAGISCLIPWKYLQPSEELPNWKIIDNLIDHCQRHHKLLILRVSTAGLDNTHPVGIEDEICSDTPDWVFDAGAKSFCHKTKSERQRLPIFWDEVYLAKWSNFVKQLGIAYDKNANIHSIGITGGGLLGGTSILPPATSPKDKHSPFEHELRNNYGLNARQLLVHWKYVADLFLKAFPTARLNFDIDPPTPDAAGQESLDEIANYLVFRYGDRIYLTRQNVSSDKHDFDQYQLILKYRRDTLTGYQFSHSVKAEQIAPIAKCALDDGVSFAELPAELILKEDVLVRQSLKDLEDNIGYQLVAKKVGLPDSLKSGEPMKAKFSFLNLGSAAPIKPSRSLDKDKAGSYKIQLTLKDQNDNSVFISLHTPTPPTNLWNAGKSIEWEKDLKMPKLKPGRYSVSLALIDVDSKHKLNVLNSLTSNKPEPTSDIALSNIQIVE